MDTNCVMCDGKAANNNKLIGCDYKSCRKVIHDNCNSEPVFADGINKFVCKEHRDIYVREENLINDTMVTPKSDVVVTSESEKSEKSEKIEKDENIKNQVHSDKFHYESEKHSSVGHVTKRKNVCAVCKKDDSSSRSILVVCLKCGKFYHDTCLLGESKIKHNVTICHICEPFNYVRTEIEKTQNDIKKYSSGRKGLKTTSASEESEVGIEKRTNFSTPKKFHDNVVASTRKSFPRKSMMPPAFEVGSGNNWNNQLVAHLQKQSFYDLPIVENVITWESFYKYYQETRDYFTPCENQRRVLKSIKNQEAIKIGGSSLQSVDDFEGALLNINRRLMRKESIILSEANKLRAAKKPHDGDYAGIVELMDKVIDFGNLVRTSHDQSYLNNYSFFLEIISKFPNYINVKWARVIHEVTTIKKRTLNYHDLSNMMLKEQKFVEIHRDNQKITEAAALNLKKDSGKPKQQQSDKDWINYNQDFFNEKLDTPDNSVYYQPKVVKPDNVPLELTCWKHINAKHRFNKCRALWDLDGKVVKALAQENNRCIICGLKEHENCPAMDKLKCQECGGKHHALYCEKRVGDKKKKNNSVNFTQFIYELNDRDESDESGDEEDCHEFDKAHNSNYTVATTENIVSKHQEITKNDMENDTDLIIPKSSASLLGSIVVKLDNGKAITLLIDSGSTLSLIEESVANELGLKGPNYPLTINWTGGHQRVDKNSRLVVVKLHNMDDKKFSKEVYFRTDNDLKMGFQTLVADEFKRFKHLKDLKLQDYHKLDGIIGIDNPWIFRNGIIIAGDSDDDPLGIKTPLGDYVMHCKYSAKSMYEDVLNNHTVKNIVSYSYVTQSDIDEYERIEKDLVENLETPNCENDRSLYEDDLAVKQLDKVYKDLNSGVYHAPLLWKEEIKLDVEKSEYLARKRLLLIERVMQDEFAECEKQVRNLLDKNYAKELSSEEIENYTEKSNYIPIFFIKPKNKRVRMIWDMAAKVNGTSINDSLVRGPNYYNDILKIQFQMCEYKNIIKGDLKEMFHQVRLMPEDTEALRFVFRFSDELHIRHYKNLVLPFGAKCSPTIAQYVKNKVADEKASLYPLVSHLMKNSTYVDDIVTSIQDEDEAVQVLADLKRNFKLGSFEMSKINSNNKTVLKESRQLLESYGIYDETDFSTSRTEKLLGYTLDFEADTISVEVATSKLPEEVRTGRVMPSKRQVLQILMSIYDPKGYFQFVTSDVKILFKKTLDLEWDESLSENLRNEWKKCVTDIEKISSVKIPRLYCNSAYDKIELHAFGDAGVDILCGVIYARFLYKGIQVGYKLIYSKTFIVPRKPVRTVPELELHMAKNLVKMIAKVIENHRIQFDQVYYYTDNGSILEWILNGSKKMTQYMKNRLDIIKNDKDAIWRWIATDKMPADLGTKKKKSEISYENRWFQPEIFTQYLTEDKMVGYHQIKIDEVYPNIIDFDKHSDWMKLIKSVIYFVKFIYWLTHIKPLMVKIKNAGRNSIPSRTVREWQKQLKVEITFLRQTEPFFGRTRRILILAAQAESLGVYNYRNHPEIKNQNAYEDANGVIRIQNRLSEDSTEHFVVQRANSIWLPRNHKLTTLLILFYHKINKHLMVKNVVAHLEMNFFIHKILSEVKKVIGRHCNWCKRYKAKIEYPLMGDLPEERLGYGEPPFTYAMLDLAGPISVKLTRLATAKRYILVYSCLTTRAVNLELIQDLTADATMRAINNAMHRVGAPKRIITDNGTNFIGAKRQFLELADEWNQKLMKNGSIIEPIDWQFGPARGPHFQGAVEIMVGLTKKVMKMSLKMINTTLTQLDEYAVNNMLMEIMGILNNRPLTMVPMEDGNHEILTPNSFLMRRSSAQMIPFPSNSNKPIKTYRDIKESMKPIWEHWLNYYLPTLIKRTKWRKMAKNLEVGDIVVTADTNIGNSWRLGRIVKVTLGSKNQVRQVEVQLGKLEKNITPWNSKKKISEEYKSEKASIVTRPATAVAKLNIEE